MYEPSVKAKHIISIAADDAFWHINTITVLAAASLKYYGGKTNKNLG